MPRGRTGHSAILKQHQSRSFQKCSGKSRVNFELVKLKMENWVERHLVTGDICNKLIVACQFTRLITNCRL